MRRRFWLVGVLILGLLTGIYGFRADKIKNPGNRTGQASPLTRALWLLSGIETAPLHLRVVDAITMQPIPGAGCVVPETNQRVETNNQGIAPAMRAPVLRNPRQDELVGELHGELAVICYKNGYRDAIVTGVRMYKDKATQFDLHMTPFGPRDKRIEPTIYHLPPHRLWQIDVADRFRLFDQGEGKESPDLTRPGNMVTPQSQLGGGVQTPIIPGPELLGIPELGPRQPGPQAQPRPQGQPQPQAPPRPQTQPQPQAQPQPQTQPQPQR